MSETPETETAKDVVTEKAPIQETEELISIDYLSKVKLRVATIIEATKVEKSKKLVQLQVKLGEEQRQIIAGISLHYEPEQLIGKNIIIVANLKPAKLMGLESQGMLLAASDEEGLELVSVSDAISSGAEVR